MAILNNNPLVGASGNQGGYNINNSLRFRSSASAYLSRTFGTPTDAKKFTFSCWVKRGSLGTYQELLGAGTSASSTNYAGLYFNDSANTVGYVDNPSGTDVSLQITNAVFRDPSAWYHIVLSVDTTQATAANRVIIYVNGVQQTLATNSPTYTQNASTFINTSGRLASIGAVRYSAAYVNYLDGYLAETYLIDGQALTPSSFGETDTTTGVWKPKAYSGTYGTNGFYLKFSDIATTSGSNAGLGKDFSGNANYWTTNNISVTSGTTYDAMTDSPTNTSATVANYCVMNAAAPYGSFLTLSQANLKSTCNGAYWAASPATFGVSSGKWYWEVHITNLAGNSMLGITRDTDTGATTGQNVYPGISANSYGYIAGGLKYNNATGTSYGATYTTNDIIGIALDMDAGTLTYYKNNTSQGTAFSGLSGTYLPSIGVNDTNTAVSVNFGQRPFSYTPPTGYVALNTFNLPTPTILQGNKYMDATTWTGDNTSPRSITNAASFKPDFVWVKGRNGTINHILVDSVRGTSKNLISNSTSAEVTTPVNGSVSAFNSTGFSVASGTSDSVEVNYSVGGTTYTYVGWQWQAGQGTNTTNTSGSITSTVSVNTTAGFSIVTYTGNNTASTVGHGLGVGPRMIIVKSRSATNPWPIYHATLGVQQYIFLNATDAAYSNLSNYWGSTAPSSTTFGIGPYGGINASGATYVAYCWAEIAGFSKFGSWTGNASTDGPFVFCNFRPRFILFKNSSAATVWIIFDTARNTYNFVDTQLRPNASDADNSAGSAYSIDVLSNGFKIRSSDSNFNGSGNTIIYAAFAENPFKNSLAR